MSLILAGRIFWMVFNILREKALGILIPSFDSNLNLEWLMKILPLLSTLKKKTEPLLILFNISSVHGT